MAYKHDDKASGQLVRSVDWNTMGHAIEGLDTAKVERAGDTITGDLTVNGKITASAATFTSSLNVAGGLNVSSGAAISGSLSVAGSLNVAGKITSPQWRVTNVMFNVPGGLPKQNTFTSAGGTLLLFVHGTGWASPNGNHIGMFVTLDGREIGLLRTMSNEPSSHKAFCANFLVAPGFAAGTHTVLLSSWNGTVTDPNDFFNVTVLEMPI